MWPIQARSSSKAVRQVRLTGEKVSNLQHIDWVAVIAWLVAPAVLWGIIIYAIGGPDALDFYLKAIVVLIVISIVGAAIGWVWEKIGGSDASN
jgi:hypothetical protein